MWLRDGRQIAKASSLRRDVGEALVDEVATLAAQGRGRASCHQLLLSVTMVFPDRGLTALAARQAIALGFDILLRGNSLDDPHKTTDDSVHRQL